jgi:anti-sigma B factor antagonist
MTVTSLKLEGRLDTAAVARMEAGFAARAGALNAQGSKAIIDLEGLTYLSSMGIRLLVSTLKQFKQRGVIFVTVAPREATVQELLKMADLNDHLNLVDSVASADAALAEAS